ncbi:MAG TPA: ribonuclease E/G [Porphyromonadaceae bacterium]|nr:ribonuclease E/G [Porphyromonadaceae bacterium]
MDNELVIDVQPKDVLIAMLEDGKLMELQKEDQTSSFAVGNIYWGKVRKVTPGMNAAFVNIGGEKDAFLHYLDLGLTYSSSNKFYRQVISNQKKLPDITKFQLQPELPKEGNISDYLKSGQEVLVQVTKEPISSKGSKVTTDITFVGRYMILTPFRDKISVSQKIKDSMERARLRQIILSIKQTNMGVIVRTAAEGKKVAELDEELKLLIGKFNTCIKKLQTAEIGTCILEESNRVVSIIRDLFNPSFQNIHINNKEFSEQIKEYVKFISPEKGDIVKFYDKEQPIFDAFDITKQIKTSFGKVVTFKGGGYLVIEHTEAMHVVDVNSGAKSDAKLTQEDNVLNVNLNAAHELSRQMRLRDMGGIIVVDFIDMDKPEHRKQLFEEMLQYMSYDHARHNILPLSKFGLMQITRQRVRPVMDIDTTEMCPACSGTGRIGASILFVDELEQKISYIVNDLKMKKIKLFLHPYIVSYLKKGILSIFWKWRFKFSYFLKVIVDESLPLLSYRFEGKDKELIDLKLTFNNPPLEEGKR